MVDHKGHKRLTQCYITNHQKNTHAKMQLNPKTINKCFHLFLNVFIVSFLQRKYILLKQVLFSSNNLELK